MFKLTPHHSNPISDFKCFAEISQTQTELIITYRIENYIAHLGEGFSSDYKKNVGLWDFDVCEAFLTFSDEKYLEIQSSPKEEPFAYLITKPREDFDFPASLNLSIESKFENETWNCRLNIEKKDIPGEGVLKGNIFVCLGPKDSRSYFALNINQEQDADFHRPDLFVELL